MRNTKRKFLTTKELAFLTSLSASFFEKGRVYGYGPPFIRINSGKRLGKILYDPAEVEAWLDSQRTAPEVGR